MSYRDVANAETEALFGGLKRTLYRGEPSRDKVSQEGPPATYVPFSFNGADVFDESDTMDVFIFIPDEMVKIVKARALLFFRQFFASATTVSSGGGSTSGSGGGSTSGSGGSSTPTSDGSAVGLNFDECPHHAGHAHISSIDSHSHSVTIGSHTHSVSAHTHTTPDHTHDLDYGVFKEALPASWSVELRLYRWTGVFWSLQHEITGLTDQLEEVDLSDYITTPGRYRIRINSAAGQPNDGRLGCDVSGHIVGAIQELRP